MLTFITLKFILLNQKSVPCQSILIDCKSHQVTEIDKGTMDKDQITLIVHLCCNGKKDFLCCFSPESIFIRANLQQVGNYNFIAFLTHAKLNHLYEYLEVCCSLEIILFNLHFCFDLYFMDKFVTSHRFSPVSY